MGGIQKSGFTLIELLIALAVVGILASIAYPSYTDHVRRTRRADAQGALMGLSNAMNGSSPKIVPTWAQQELKPFR
jgi:type IV pilus assembly protein PilE